MLNSHHITQTDVPFAKRVGAHQLRVLLVLARPSAYRGRLVDEQYVELNSSFLDLAMPSWVHHCDQTPHAGVRRRVSEKVLGPFDFGETAAYVTDRLSATRWSAASGFKGELHIASGGLPRLVNAIGNAAARHAHGNEITQDNIQYAVANDSSLTDIGNRILDDAFAVNWEAMRNNRSHYTMLTAMREAIERQEKDPMMDGFTQDEWWRLVEGVVGGITEYKNGVL